ncbi:binding domain of DNA repair protein ercc1 (rad10/Swi10) domain-containing protein [Sarocladium implicatum]|nr:binding domain of DNA repair protein ercc1 (rad10/Swi10) domain-containing protein [Sarocladium implicatum]
MDDDYGADDDLLAAMAAADPTPRPQQQQQQPRPVQQPIPTKIQQPTPQRLDKAPPAAGSSGAKVVQPTPQALPTRQTGSTILVSPRQRGNPVLTNIKKMPWEYSDIPADFVMGATTCALFLSLKYHRLHPEYIYTRIRNLQGKYNLRVLLTMVDIPNHEDPLRELSKTSLVNNVSLILCWSAAEAAHYLELYKSHEHNASFAAIKGQQSSGYADRLTDFVTVPRSLNKSDAVALVANFGSLRNAVNAEPEVLGMIGGWGGVKVKRWTKAVEEPFRSKTAASRGLEKQGSSGAPRSSRLNDAVPLCRVPLREMSSMGAASSGRDSPAAGAAAKQQSGQFRFAEDDDDDDDAVLAAAIAESQKDVDRRSGAAAVESGSAQKSDELSGGVAAALAKLRENG